MANELFTELMMSSLKGATDFVHTYASKENEYVNLIKNYSGIKSELYSQNIFDNMDKIKFLSMYSDLTSLFMLPDNISEHLAHFYEPEHELFIERKIEFPSGILPHRPKPHELYPGYTTRTDNDTKNIVQTLSPLIEREKLILRPIRTITVENQPGIRADRVFYYAGSDTPTEHWVIKSGNEDGSYVIDNGLKRFQSEVLYEVTLPYISSISVSNLTSVLDDEEDLLGGFRKELKDLMLMRVTQRETVVNEVRNDYIRPQIETINRKFKKLKDLHRFSVGAITGVTLTLLGLHATTDINFQSLFGALGTGIIGMIPVEGQYHQAEEGLRESPYFLLWRISRVNNTKVLTQFKS